MAPSKRRLASSSQSTQSSQQSSTTRGPPKKRARHSPPHPTSLPLPLPSAAPRASTSTSKPQEKDDGKPPLPEAKKRPLHPGSLRRLTTSRPSSTLPDEKQRAKQTLSGNKIGGKSKDLKDGSRGKIEEIWVRNSSNKNKKGGGGVGGGGMGFSAWLKKGVGAFVERGCTCLKVHGMAATIPTALSLALAIRDAVPGGSPLDEDGDDDLQNGESDSDDDREELEGVDKEGKEEEKRERKRGIFRMQVLTGTTVVGDEITPLDDDEDMIYQSRSKSTIEIVLTLDEELGKMVGVGKAFARKDGGGGRGRGAKRRGGMRGRGMGRGRGK